MQIKKIFKAIYNAIPIKKQIFHAYLSVLPSPPPEYILKHLHFKGKFKVQVEDQFFYMYHYGFQIENEIFWKGIKGGFEKVSVQTWIRLCKDSNYVLDIGANTGLYALIAKTVNPMAKIYAFEPVKRVFDKLMYNCSLNKFDINCENIAISNFDGTAVIYDTPSEHIYSVTINKNLNPPNQVVIPTEVCTKKLSSFIEKENLQSIDLMKVDVEHHEAEVLEGMEGYLHKFHPSMLIEIVDEEVAKRIENFLKGMDYLFFDINEQDSPKIVKALTKSSKYNYLICNQIVAKRLKLV